MTFDPFQPFEWKLAHGRSIILGPRSVIMGVLNVTPDSFSDGGKFSAPDAAIAQASRMIESNAAIIDIGGESSRPGADEISAAEEQARVLPVVEALREIDVAISVDTWRASTARLALDAGAHIINDIWGLLRDREIATVCSVKKAGVVAMHNGRGRALLADPVEDQQQSLKKSIEVAEAAGITNDQMILDPGFGFAKDTATNLELLARLEELHALGRPLLIGTSRKRFIGEITGQPVDKRDIGTAATSVVARMKGGTVFRVHDVGINAQSLSVADAVLGLPEKPL